MKSFATTFSLALTTLLITAFSVAFSDWNIDPDYTIRFEGRQAEGTFSGLDGTIRFDPKNLDESLIDVSVEVATIKTGNGTKDKHARGESWFDAERYPHIKFKSRSFTKTSEGSTGREPLPCMGLPKK